MTMEEAGVWSGARCHQCTLPPDIILILIIIIVVVIVFVVILLFIAVIVIVVVILFIVFVVGLSRSYALHHTELSNELSLYIIILL